MLGAILTLAHQHTRLWVSTLVLALATPGCYAAHEGSESVTGCLELAVSATAFDTEPAAARVCAGTEIIEVIPGGAVVTCRTFAHLTPALVADWRRWADDAPLESGDCDGLELPFAVRRPGREPVFSCQAAAPASHARMMSLFDQTAAAVEGCEIIEGPVLLSFSRNEWRGPSHSILVRPGEALSFVVDSELLPCTGQDPAAQAALERAIAWAAANPNGVDGDCGSLETGTVDLTVDEVELFERSTGRAQSVCDSEVIRTLRAIETACLAAGP